MRISNHDNTVQDLFNPNPEILYSANEPDGDASPWVEAPVGSQSIETGVPSVVWQKVASNNDNADWVGRGFLSQHITFDQMTDSGGINGYIDLTGTLPAGSVVKQVYCTNVTGWAGDTSGTFDCGVDGDQDRFVKTGAIDVTSDTDHVDCGSPSGTEFCSTETTVRVTVFGASDFSSITAGALTVHVEFTVPNV